ncbi:uncharacterized protein CMU_022850 [Cryptosporidium muris RN66]|uniref:Uncharacterized protein n=1 Tax=Cryptosporidium muris (strain RN66) TaxID=441375 RepID=B6ABS7_CRYMR|nr:uncharacterized protein CMU_022850 [Cryptosporidium muris RN66]EEA05280.1 hypothetical protein, conserved [Cryptosporidium muris RN66]|eukprot:XP_002139629.1 hypothetical protein [Cryptosporidium muris RN66]
MHQLINTKNLVDSIHYNVEKYGTYDKVLNQRDKEKDYNLIKILSQRYLEEFKIPVKNIELGTSKKPIWLRDSHSENILDPKFKRPIYNGYSKFNYMPKFLYDNLNKLKTETKGFSKYFEKDSELEQDTKFVNEEQFKLKRSKFINDQVKPKYKFLSRYSENLLEHLRWKIALRIYYTLDPGKKDYIDLNETKKILWDIFEEDTEKAQILLLLIETLTLCFNNKGVLKKNEILPYIAENILENDVGYGLFSKLKSIFANQYSRTRKLKNEKELLGKEELQDNNEGDFYISPNKIGKKVLSVKSYKQQLAPDICTNLGVSNFRKSYCLTTKLRNNSNIGTLSDHIKKTLDRKKKTIENIIQEKEKKEKEILDSCTFKPELNWPTYNYVLKQIEKQKCLKTHRNRNITSSKAKVYKIGDYTVVNEDSNEYIDDCLGNETSSFQYKSNKWNNYVNDTSEDQVYVLHRGYNCEQSNLADKEMDWRRSLRSSNYTKDTLSAASKVMHEFLIFESKSNKSLDKKKYKFTKSFEVINSRKDDPRLFSPEIIIAEVSESEKEYQGEEKINEGKSEPINKSKIMETSVQIETKSDIHPKQIETKSNIYPKQIETKSDIHPKQIETKSNIYPKQIETKSDIHPKQNLTKTSLILKNKLLSGLSPKELHSKPLTESNDKKSNIFLISDESSISKLSLGKKELDEKVVPDMKLLHKLPLKKESLNTEFKELLQLSKTVIDINQLENRTLSKVFPLEQLKVTELESKLTKKSLAIEQKDIDILKYQTKIKSVVNTKLKSNNLQETIILRTNDIASKMSSKTSGVSKVLKNFPKKENVNIEVNTHTETQLALNTIVKEPTPSNSLELKLPFSKESKSIQQLVELTTPTVQKEILLEISTIPKKDILVSSKVSSIYEKDMNSVKTSSITEENILSAQNTLLLKRKNIPSQTILVPKSSITKSEVTKEINPNFSIQDKKVGFFNSGNEMKTVASIKSPILINNDIQLPSKSSEVDNLGYDMDNTFKRQNIKQTSLLNSLNSKSLQLKAKVPSKMPSITQNKEFISKRSYPTTCNSLSTLKKINGQLTNKINFAKEVSQAPPLLRSEKK